jgi:hypothetical protein
MLYNLYFISQIGNLKIRVDPLNRNGGSIYLEILQNIEYDVTMILCIVEVISYSSIICMILLYDTVLCIVTSTWY